MLLGAPVTSIEIAAKSFECCQTRHKRFIMLAWRRVTPIAKIADVATTAWRMEDQVPPFRCDGTEEGMNGDRLGRLDIVHH